MGTADATGSNDPAQDSARLLPDLAVLCVGFSVSA